MKTQDIKVTGDVCARELGVGQPTVIAAKKMLGISGARKVWIGSIRAFLQKYQDFRLADAENMERFRRRHPEFTLPYDSAA